ncbi:hypothetical protein CAEBREN_30331 [Caenorhabditis brenneri]|uniref:Uncharacterized protein n=1 Tax=Caenorhabditis brenneri TaxID=135651 RepID=G0MSE7_CAEBE|nr:hypothetical protein CAEBREN_30331 [Caenorhabditis brenneri]
MKEYDLVCNKLPPLLFSFAANEPRLLLLVSPGATTLSYSYFVRELLWLIKMSIQDLTNEINHIVIERRLKHQDSELTEGGHHEKGHLTRKSSTSSNCSSGFDKRRNICRKDSEVKIEAIFKELFSPDAKIIDHYEGEMLMIPATEIQQPVGIEVVVPNHDRFKLRRQTSLVPKTTEMRKNLSPDSRIRAINQRSLTPKRKLSSPTAPRKRPNFTTVADDASSGTYLRKNRTQIGD